MKADKYLILAVMSNTKIIFATHLEDTLPEEVVLG